jgi:hypothetical protein
MISQGCHEKKNRFTRNKIAGSGIPSIPSANVGRKTTERGNEGSSSAEKPQWRQKHNGSKDHSEREKEITINQIQDGAALTRHCNMTFHKADVRSPLASAAKMTEAGNTIVLTASGGYVENNQTKEKLKVRKERGVFLMDIVFEDGKEGTITLDSGAGVSVWPSKMNAPGVEGPPEPGLRMVAANGSAIQNFGTKMVKFQGAKVERPYQEEVFSRQA